MARFVILEHSYQGVHWDFMLDTGTALRTWRLDKPPEENCEIAAIALPDHRRTYLDYEGEVSGGRGHVVRWDAGEFEWLTDQPDFLSITIRGNRVRGWVRLTKSESDSWTLRLTPAAGASGQLAMS